MNTNKYEMKKLSSGILLSILLITMSACSSKNQGVEEVDIVAVDGGTVITDTVSINAVVVSMDPAKRKITLADDMGGKATYKIAKEVDTLDQVKVGDMISAVVTEEIGLFIGVVVPPEIAQAGGIIVTPDGEAAAGALVDVQQYTAVVTEVNAKKHKVTFTLPDGSTKKVKMNKELDLSALRVGTPITIQVADGLAVEIIK